MVWFKTVKAAFTKAHRGSQIAELVVTVRGPGVSIRLPPRLRVEEMLNVPGKLGLEVVVLRPAPHPFDVLTRLGPKLCTCTSSITCLVIKSPPG